MSLRKIFIIGVFLYLFALVCNNYYFIFENSFIGKIIVYYRKIFVSSRNGLFEGLMFVSAGMLIYNCYVEKKINYPRTLLLTIVSYVLLVLEMFLIRGKNYLDDGSLFISFIIFIPLFIAYCTKFVSNRDTSMVRKYSTAIFFMHVFIINIFELLFSLLNIEYTRLLEFIIVVCVLLAITTILLFVNNKKINKVVF